jgi:biotin-dependent carboxylase-like uncharacterized protein
MGEAAEPVLRILMAGPGVTLQDGGRHGYLRFGVTPAGPMDRLAFETANRALGNPPDTTAIEVGLGGLELTVDTAPLAVAIAGGDFAITLDGRRLPPAVLLRLDIGAVLKITPGAAGAWCYVALAGRLQVPPMLGSTATHARSGFGGIEGRGLAAGDRLSLSEPHMPLAFGSVEAPWLDRPAAVIRVILGPQDDYFAPDQVAAFLAGPWRLTARGDRMAYFLEGPRLEHSEGFNIVSDGVALGAIQVQGEGQPIVLMADRQPTGGYPKIATVIGPDLGRLAQARPGQSIRFQVVAVEEAVAARRAERERLEAGMTIAPLIRTEFSPAFLLGQHLTDGIVTAEVPPVTREARHAAGKLTARERLEVLFDDAVFEVLGGAAPSALVLAQGRVEGRPVYAASRDVAVRGGALTACDARALGDLIARATADRAPVVLLFDGQTLAEADDAATLEALAALHAVFYAADVPRFAVALGPCVGPDALLAAAADSLIVTADQAFVAGSGPALVKALTNESVTGEEIGGPAALAAAGILVDSAPNDVAALLRARRLLDALPDQGEVSLPDVEGARDVLSLDRLVPRGKTEVYDIHDLLIAVADDGDFLEIAPDCAGNLVAGFMRLGGRAVGILANQPLVLAGALDAAALGKAARFAECCGALALPLVSVVDCPGLLPGPAQARAALLPHAAAFARALARFTLPRVAIVTRNAAVPVPAVMGFTGSAVYRWPSAVPPVCGTLIAPRETRRWFLAALANAERRAC